MILKETVAAAQAGMRLDDGAALLFEGLSKTRLRRIIDLGGCTVNGTMVRVASRALRQGDEIVLGVMEPGRFKDLVYCSESILYEDEEVVGVCKPAGFNSQRTPYQLKGTVEYAVGVYLKCAAERRTGADHSPAGSRYVRGDDLSEESRSRGPAVAVVEGRTGGEALPGPGDRSCLRMRVAGGPADSKSRFGALRGGQAGQGGADRLQGRGRGDGAALVEARPLTGRTHQIRVHLAHCGLPIVGDSTYGGVAAPRMMLHCRSMAFEGKDGRVISVTARIG